MSELFRAITERLKAIFAANTALELEAELIASHIERKAALLRVAAQCEQEGFDGLAEELRKYTEGMNPRQPATAILPTNLDMPIPALVTISNKTSDDCNKQEPSARKRPR